MRSTRELCTAVRRGVTAIRQVAATRGTHVKSSNDGTQQTRNSMAGSRFVTRSSSGLAGSSSSSIQTTTDDVPYSIYSRPVSTHPDTRHTQSTTSLSQWVDCEKKWLFPADNRFMEMYNTVKNGGYGQGVRITYKSKVPVTPQMVETALHCLTRKANSFRTCLQYRGDELWVVELMKPDLDFKVLEGVTNTEQALLDLIVQPCQLFEGPLWSARMLLPPQEGHQDTKDPYPYTSQLLFSLNHVMHDGVGLLWALFWMLEILDNILSGVQTNDQPFGILHSGLEISQEEDKIRKELLKDPLTLRRLLNEQAEKNTIPLIAEAFELPEEEYPVTISLETEVISSQIMEQLGKKCKSVGVTLNSCFLAAYNVALVELIQKAGLDRDVYNITSVIPVNTRRLVTESGFHLGCYSVPLHHTTATPRDVKNNFWQYAKEIDDSVRGKMRKKQFLTDRVLDRMLQEEGHIPNTQCEFPPLKYDYSLSNVYSAPTPFSGLGKNIKLDYYCNLIAIEKTCNGNLTAVMPRGKQAQIKTCNSSRYMTEETVIRWNKGLVRVLLHEGM